MRIAPSAETGCSTGNSPWLSCAATIGMYVSSIFIEDKSVAAISKSQLWEDERVTLEGMRKILRLEGSLSSACCRLKQVYENQPIRTQLQRIEDDDRTSQDIW
jgi:hypothetical protein